VFVSLVGVIAVRMRDERGLDRLPGVDMKVSSGAIKAAPVDTQ
jgi:hypothetical protein